MRRRSVGHESKTIIVLDTAAFFVGLPLMLNTRFYTVPEVIREVKDEESKAKLELASLLERVEVIEAPSKREVTEKLPRRLLVRLSETDIKLLALALKLAREKQTVIVATDDYALQESCVVLGIDFIPVRTMGIKESCRRK